MGYAAYQASEQDLLDLAVDEAAQLAGGDLQAAILQLVRRQHLADEAAEAATADPAEASAAAA